MRHARAQDFYRRIREKPEHWPVRVDRISFKGVPSLGEGDIPLTSVLTVLCGPNGVGKTSLLRAIWATLDPAAAARKVITARKLSAGTASVGLHVGSEILTCEVTFVEGEIKGGKEHGIEIVHLDSSTEVLQQQEVFCSYDSAEDVINGEGGRTLDEKELATLNYLTKRDYRTVQVYELELAEAVLPFFEVTFGADRYDSRTMGAGELAAFYLWWSLARAAEGSIVLIEEPECYLSPSSQDAFRDYVASMAFLRKLCVVMTSHSAQIIAPLGKESTRFFRRDAQGIKLVADRPPPILLETLGIKPPVDTIVFVEDAAGSTFCRLWLERLDPNLSRRIEIMARNGEGEIINAVRQLRGPFKFIRFVGLFDGDMRGKIPDDVQPMSVHLPGDKAIEIVFREMVATDPIKVAEATGWTDLETILFGLQGSDHHDWYHKLGQHVGLTKPQLFAALFTIWMKDEANSTAAGACYRDLLNLMDGTADVPQPV
ncbi:ATP-dependent endonuclease [Bradyrhizobium sp. SBR1B]|uniref:ATP-dependent nuclease n=1 Tax=Bradyrhizobium sp. SBR1B TaxID=2663836 RepID=UPI001606B133|nr:AAA family ATPase [Bradyrhizobium sp. SBR1B]MBB4376484.1 ABC-type cobalamin/Fe3+-siderophores transport system ATPase subunit [Bradyrhizobium sp. SBR1B]